jgi:hypothetical protein
MGIHYECLFGGDDAILEVFQTSSFVSYFRLELVSNRS